MAVKANEILAYKGDSALAGGLGAAGTAQTIQGVWKMADSINQSVAMLRAQEFKRNQDLYEQRIKDRDTVGRMIADGSFATNEMDDADRLAISSEVKNFKNKFIEAAKKGNLSDEQYLELTADYAKAKSRADIAKTDYLALQADMKMNANPYDKDSPTKVSTKVFERDADGRVIRQEESTSREKNAWGSDENVKGFELHVQQYRDAKAKDPNTRYKPYVPVSNIDYDNAYVPLGTDQVRKDLGNGKIETTTIPSFDKTAMSVLQKWQNPTSRKDMERAYEQVVSAALDGNIAGVTAITDANKKIMAINAMNANIPSKQGEMLPLITKDTNIPTTMAILSFTAGLDNVPPPKVSYETKNAEKLEADINTTNENIRQTKENAKINREEAVTEYEQKLKLDNKYKQKDGESKSGLTTTALTEIYKQRSAQINDTDPATPGYSPAEKEQKLKDLQTEIFLNGLVPTENGWGKLDTKNKNTSALGNYQMTKGTRESMYRLMGIPKAKWAQAEEDFKTDANFQTMVASKSVEEINNRIPKSVTGTKRLYMLAKAWYTGDPNYPDNQIPRPDKGNKMTAGEYATQILNNISKLYPVTTDNTSQTTPAPTTKKKVKEVGKTKSGITFTVE